MSLQTKPTAIILLSICLMLIMGTHLFAQTTLPAPKQEEGLPYTRSARVAAIKEIRDVIAIFAGSRYAYVHGSKVRLDDLNWRDEAVLKVGVVYVPLAFAGIVELPQVEPAPEFLKDRWVHSVQRAKVELRANIRRMDVDGRAFVSIEDLARSAGLGISKDESGLVLLGGDEKHPPMLPRGAARDSVVTLFDTPEKFADPDLATKYIPNLARQGKWTDHVKVTSEQLAMLNGPETKWKYTPKSEYDYTGFNTALLGSAVPPPGVYPRILFSEQDIPMLAERIKSTEQGRKSWIERTFLLNKSFWDPKTSDGQIFQKLSSGDLSGLDWPEVKEGSAATDVPQQFKNQKAGIYSSHIAYVPEALANMALQCLLEKDDVRGRQVAAAIVNYFRLREPLVDEWNSVSDSEFGSFYTRPNGLPAYVNGNGSSSQWRNIHGIVAQMNLGLAMDFGGKWMTPDEKDFMRRFIAKATYGRRGFGQDGSPRFRDVNWVSWDLPNYLALLAIEGLEGCDTEALACNQETVRAFCQWGIDERGVVYESNGKTAGGFQFLFLSMIAQARRGDNLFGHPHFRKLLEGQIQMTSPSGKVIVNSGTQYVPHSRQILSPQFVQELKAFYPENRCADYLLHNVALLSKEDPKDETARFFVVDGASDDDYLAHVAKLPRLRMASPMYPGFVRSFLYDADYHPTKRAELNLPLEFSAPTHGIFSAYSDATPNATWINMMVRPDHYLGAGHHHADAGMFHFSALGVDWITESPFPQAYSGIYHNQVLVDGKSEADNLSGIGTAYQAAANYLGATTDQDVSQASADLTNSYSYSWQTQPSQVWPDDGRIWELDPSSRLAEIFAGTARYKMRPWWATSNYSNFIATARTPFNPMEYVFRTVGLVRGPHPFGFIVDNLKKDNQPHSYRFTAMLNDGVVPATLPNLPSNCVALAYRQPSASDVPSASNSVGLQPVHAVPGEPLLLVVSLSPVRSNSSDALIELQRLPGAKDRSGKQLYYDRLSINQNAVAANFQTLLIPYRMGDPLFEITATGLKWDEDQVEIVVESSSTGCPRTVVNHSRPSVRSK